ncbi:MAG TPA: cyanophycin synthetase [Sphaerochaeta sp.]|jgi:UDP-N-acetylmuramate--alanine ligase|nr:cyanophycin synthetase [Sphaerochaeta sp.]HQB54035.1 cyanophycin synthetase [Sphaerochaeta sp.]
MNLPFRRIYLVGIKGSGMARLALLLANVGCRVGGCDGKEDFFTGRSLAESGIVPDVGFDRSNLEGQWDAVIHSAAYPSSTDILVYAKERDIPLYSYPEFLALLSTLRPTYLVIGTHGKTTTSAMSDHLLGEEGGYWAVYGSTLLDRKDSFRKEPSFHLFEGCEYQDHFLLYQTTGAVLLSVEYDHPDYFADLADVYDSFKRFVDGIEKGGFFIYNNDQAGSKAIGEYAKATRTDLLALSFGFDQKSDYPIVKEQGRRYRIGQIDTLLTVETPELVIDHLGALLLATVIRSKNVDPVRMKELAPRLATFSGVVGRLEYMGEREGILFFDDYAHHPSEIIVSLREMRTRFPDKNILVLFMPHTASRTHALLDEFAEALTGADHLILQPTYASARNDEETDPLALYAVLKTETDCTYAQDEDEAIAQALMRLKEGWLCITMGAGNNRALNSRLLRSFL